MIGATLIYGGSKKARFGKAWDMLAEQGFLVGKESPDLLVISREADKKSIGISQAKQVRTFLKERPFEGKIKAILIEDAQSLTDDAQNSLLSILEEPPCFASIILLCDREFSLLPTVVSRCRKVYISAGKEEAKSSTSLNVASMKHEQVFDLAKEMSLKSKDEVIEFLEELLRADIQRPLIDNRKELITKTEKMIKEIKNANVALKFAMEYILLLHKSAL
jgi:DNA polymerase-3 subunit delta'